MSIKKSDALIFSESDPSHTLHLMVTFKQPHNSSFHGDSEKTEKSKLGITGESGPLAAGVGAH